MRYLKWLFALALIGAGAFWVLTWPARIAEADLPAHEPNAERGAQIFALGGCTSCHAAPGAAGEALMIMAGGLALKTDFGTFYAPNISPSGAGIGGWSMAEFATAMQNGVSPSGQHYFPAFPFTSYTRMPIEDVMDLKAYMDTLPEDATPSRPHDVGFPFSFRRGLGLWKLLYLREGPVLDVPADLAFGQMLVEGAGHCAECHTPRNMIGGPDLSRWMAGGPNPDGPGKIPNITPHDDALGSWAEADIAYYLESGFTPEFDSAGGAMAHVVENMAKLPPDWRAAMAAYLKALPAAAPD